MDLFEYGDNLKQKYPHLFPERGFHGISIDVGWYDLVQELIEKIDEIVKANNVTFTIFQIKSKFGGLRFYYGFECENNDSVIDKTISDLVDKYEKMSYLTCERCGAKADNPTQFHKVKGGWIYTVCDNCFSTM